MRPAMMKAVRFLLIVMLALAVPFQGALAVSAGPCVALGHHDGAAGDGLDHAQNPHCAPSVAISAAVQFQVPEARAETAVPALPTSFSGILLHELYRPPLAL
jgi:hypothetical protein